jgi:Protein of unknown function (DUF2635)
MKQLFVKPGEGTSGQLVRPRHPHTKQPLSVEGEYWDDNVFTRRRLKDGDIVEVEPPAQKTSSKKTSSKNK